MLFPTGIKKLENVNIFSDAFKAKAIIDWAKKQLDKPVETSIDHLTSDTYKSVCKNTKGTCVIFFLEK